MTGRTRPCHRAGHARRTTPIQHTAGDPDLIRSPKRVLAHTWEGLLE
jgi:hypothetical protein